MAAMAIENEDDAEAGAAAEEDKVEMIVIQLLKIACVPKGPLKRCYSDLLQKFQDLKIISAAAAALSELEFRALFEELFKLHIHESLDSPTAAFWQGTVPSRFEAEFENLGELGRGAFGIVYKCKSKLEEKIYAVKVINIPENTKKEDKLKVLREVITLSQLEHDNVVRYYTSWVQDIIDTDTPVVASPEAAAAVTREPPSPSAGTPSPSAGTPCAGYDMDNFLAAYEAGEFAEASCPAGTPAQHPLLPVPSSNDAASQAPSRATTGEKGSWQAESKGYQFWAQADADRNFHIKHVHAGRYDLYGWVPGVLGDYKKEGGSLDIHPGSLLEIGDLDEEVS